tara:strand:+ start:2138 stop:3364 length:1227 start_codon:yes stop_codon:yes gene_type:complete
MNKESGGFTMGGMKTACITGLTGQDGSYLAKLLLDKGYRVVGVRRRTSTDNLWRLRILGIAEHENLEIVEGDITDLYSLLNIFKKYNPQEVYNLAAMSHVGVSFEQPKLTWDVTAQGAINVVDAALLNDPNTRVYQASTSEMMGSHFEEYTEYEVWSTDCLGNAVYRWDDTKSIYQNPDTPTGWGLTGKERTVKIQSEDTKMDGNSPYGCAKFAAHNYMRVLRESNQSYVCCGILYNHGSPLRGENFFERKVTKYVGDLCNFIYKNLGNAEDVVFMDENLELNGVLFPKLRLGDLSTYRDMGHSKDYVKAMWAMLQQDEPEDFIICTGETFQMKDIVNEAFTFVGLDYKDYIVIDPKFFRPREVEYLRGDCSKAKAKLDWTPEYTMSQMIQEMVDHDLEWASEGRNYG